MELLNAQIAQAEGRLRTLEAEMRTADADLAAFSDDQLRFDALQEVCSALDRLSELDAEALFWDGLADAGGATHLNRMRGRLATFEAEIRGTRDQQEALKERINGVLDELNGLDAEVHDAIAREERRKDEFVVEREISPVPFRVMVMPWTTRGEEERFFRRSVFVAMLVSLLFGSLIPLVTLPIPDRTAVVVEIPERLAMLVKKQPPLPEPVPEPVREEKKPEAEKAEKTAKADKPQKPREKQAKPKAAPGAPAAQVARKKAEKTGVLAFKSSFEDLIDEVPVAKLGTEARLKKQVPQAAGQARVRRSLVAMQAQGGTSGGIANYAVSTDLGSGRGNGGAGTAERIGGVGFSHVESAVAGLEEASRPLSDGPGPGRTDEEIQIVFDRYKATLYRIYNTALRTDPTLRGKMLLRITIEPNGAVSACQVEATDLDSSDLVGKIVDRVKRFNFGPKEDVPQLTILYPIDFLPAS
ncbi:MAG TPA: AgmX/PglI C-terminal domain-containing protein [Geothermobacteraceae bacterium]|nr:AgmX/PglI C-terminal domain-containing protein [Geothermobacteraceae bacterium]